MRLQQVIDRGFDLSTARGVAARRVITVRCSQCEALVINGVACHETGCPNSVHECQGCNALIPARQRYCSDCQ